MRLVKITQSSSPLVWFDDLVGETIPICGINPGRFAVPDFTNFSKLQLEKVGRDLISLNSCVIHRDCYIEVVYYNISELITILNEEVNQNN